MVTRNYFAREIHNYFLCELSYFRPRYIYLYSPRIQQSAYRRIQQVLNTCMLSKWVINKNIFLYPQYLIKKLIFRRYLIKVDSLQYHKSIGQSGGNENYNLRYQNKTCNSQCPLEPRPKQLWDMTTAQSQVYKSLSLSFS